MYQWLAEAIDNDNFVITASRRLSRVLKPEYGKQQIALGHEAWRTPNIRFLDDWLSSIVESTPETLPIILNGHASAIIWERCLTGQTGDQLLNIGGLVRQARQSWQRLHDWRVPISEISTTARSQDEILFAAAARKYLENLEDNNWIDGAQLTAFVSNLFEKGIAPAPTRIVHAGFDRLVPAVEYLLSTLQKIGCKSSPAHSGEPAAEAAVMQFDNAQAELRAAGAWARRELEESPGAIVGIVSSSLDKDGASSDR